MPKHMAVNRLCQWVGRDGHDICENGSCHFMAWETKSTHSRSCVAILLRNKIREGIYDPFWGSQEAQTPGPTGPGHAAEIQSRFHQTSSSMELTLPWWTSHNDLDSSFPHMIIGNDAPFSIGILLLWCPNSIHYNTL